MTTRRIQSLELRRDSWRHGRFELVAQIAVERELANPTSELATTKSFPPDLASAATALRRMADQLDALMTKP